MEPARRLHGIDYGACVASGLVLVLLALLARAADTGSMHPAPA